MKPLLIFGAGGHGACVVAAAMEAGSRVAACLDDAHGAPVLGVPSLLAHAFKWPRAFEFVVAIGDCAARRAKFLELLARGGTPKTIIHPRAYASPHAVISRGSVIFANATIDPRVTIGENVIVNIGASVAHDSLVESHSHIAPNVSLCGCGHIGEGAWIGAGSSLIQHVTVGPWSYIGAGSVIVRDIPARHKAFGNPAHHNCQPILQRA